MSPRVTVGLLAVLIALGGYVYFGGSAQTSQPAGSAKNAADQQLDVFKFDDRGIRLVVAEQGDRRTLVEKDSDGNWMLPSTGQPADRSRLSSLLLRFSSLRASRRLAAGNLADFGLTTPASMVRLTHEDGTEYVLLFGAKAPAEAGTYAMKPDDSTVYVVSNALAQDVEKLVTDPPVAPPTPTPSPTEEAEATATPTP